ncbi:MAG: formylglycine-generating enzyme family protein [Balneolaceae bacterium]
MKNGSFYSVIFLLLTISLFSCSKDDQKASTPYQIPEDMVLIPGGINTIGAMDGLPNEKPMFEAEMESFLMDKNPVTVAEFRIFVEETGYVTEAEQIGNGVVFDFNRGEWAVVEGVTWELPNGPNNEPAVENHPVRQVSWNDANKYLEWVGKRLPTEIEWEHAAKGGKNSEQPYAWGNSLVESGTFQANTWDGVFPVENIAEDGYLQTSPVGEFSISELGLADMGGNVWEWTEDWYRSYENREKPFNPNSLSEKVLRGGSFMCHVSYCHGYRVSARSHSPPDNALFHVGFRGVKDL